MQTTNQSPVETFQHGPFRLYEDPTRQLKRIHSNPDMEGYLAYDREQHSFAQVRFVTSTDPGSQRIQETIWSHFLQAEDCEICPRILSMTRIGGRIPCCITTIPAGEPIGDFLVRNGALPAEVAVALVLDFVRDMREHKLEFHRQFAIAPESIWIVRTKNRPRIVLGELSTTKSKYSPEEHNTRLCQDLLHYLSAGARPTQGFEALVQELSSTRDLASCEKAMDLFVKTNPSANYWMGYNDPASIAESVVSPFLNLPQNKEESAFLRNTRKALWPALICVTVLALSFIGYAIYHFADIKPVEKIAQAPAEVIPVMPYEMTAPTPQPQTIIVNPPPKPAPAPKQARPKVVYTQPNYLPKTNRLFTGHSILCPRGI